MDPIAVTLQKLAEQVRQNDGKLPLALLLEHLVPVGELRALAQKHGLSPKGGFRIDKAPARVLAPLLVEQRDAKLLDEVIGLLAKLAPARIERAGLDEAKARAQVAVDAQVLLSLRESELVRLRDELERAREVLARAREREAMLQRQMATMTEELLLVRRECDDRLRGAGQVPPSRDDRGLLQRLHELESEREGFLSASEATRRQLARDRTRLRELEDEVAELEALVPKSRRKKQRPLPPLPAHERRFLVPRFLPSFYKSLEGKERRSVERAMQAILLFCTEGHGYPGLEVKQLGGQDTWSLRASLGLRVYFRPLPDGDIELLELGDREDQHTTLRRLKER